MATTPEETTTPSTTLLLVRHGVTPTTGKVLPGRANGLHLAEAGNDQAKMVAQHVAALQDSSFPRRVEAIYASPLERTTETAAFVAETTGLTVRSDPDLLELDIGDWTGATLEEARKQPEWSRVQRYPSGFRFPGGESFLDMQVRMLAFVERIRSDHPDQVVVAVSHADPIRALVAHALGIHLDLFQRVAVSPCSITSIDYGATGPTVLAVNAADATHLIGT